MNKTKWQFNESIQVGASYKDIERVRRYDVDMQKFRDYSKEARSIICKFNICKNDIIVEFGCGTGALTVELAKTCRHIYAVDVSQPMLSILKEKSRIDNLDNISCVNDGFLSYIHKTEPADVIVSKAALHHLPDFWKIVALDRINKMMKNGGRLFLSDVVFSFNSNDYSKEIEGFINSIKSLSSDNLYNDSIMHIREEFSTYDWIIDEMLERAGFKIENKYIKSKTNIDYYCIKK